ncbi:MAG: GNAT family N-acetyltransferase, partial [Eudoraea sp.]|uniref:GNAT family N-acetyltransferase n=1 Tax=Eudoraea sp. TaxID=1979955 RepID=UPI003C72A7BA
SQDCEPPKIKGNPSDYELVHLEIEEIEVVRKNIVGSDQIPRILDFHSQIKCIALRHEGEIAAFTLIELDHFNYNRMVFHLKENEAYLFHMYTFESYRGKNLAPYLRYQSYLMLRDMGRDKIYSITQYFNKSSKNFKKKLNARNLQLYINIIIFKKYQHHFVLRSYNT